MLLPGLLMLIASTVHEAFAQNHRTLLSLFIIPMAVYMHGGPKTAPFLYAL